MLYSTRGLIHIAKALTFFFLHGFRKPLLAFGRLLFICGGKHLLFHGYRWYLKFKRRFSFVMRPLSILFSRAFKAHYVFHVAFIMMALLVATTSISARSTETSSDLGDNGIIEENVASGVTSRISSYLDANANISAPKNSKPAIGGSEEDDPGVQLALVTGSTAMIAPSINSTHIKESLRESVVQYVVETGDTISTIAEDFGISVNTLLWENNLSYRSTIRPGMKLSILPVSGISHKVKKGETIGSISKKYKVEKREVLAFNELSNDAVISVGQKLIIPEGEKPKAPVRRSRGVPSFSAPSPANVTPGAKMIWPTSVYRITQYFTWRHGGLDIAGGTYSTPIYATHNGVVSRTGGGWSGGYGNHVFLDNENGMTTRYAHLTKIYVKRGQHVKKGDVLGAMGTTGRSTGIHLHFEILKNGRRVNPLPYIR